MLFFEDVVPFIVAVGAFLIPVMASLHIILSKDDVRAAIGWAGLVWLVPFFGAVFYLLFGINRIRRRAARVRPVRALAGEPHKRRRDAAPLLSEFLPDASPGMVAEGELMDRVGRFPLTARNSVTCHINGEQAYPAMLEAIAGAEHSIAFSTYIFDRDAAGEEFIKALARAVKRGVKVRVLIDAVGSLYSRPRSIGALRDNTIPVAEFNTSRLPWKIPYLNLRNHRKLLIVDGKTGFTGGMNIRAGHYVARAGRAAIQDLHFQLEGPVVRHLMQVFSEDWVFADGETLTGTAWFPNEMAAIGSTVARGIPDGPDGDIDKIPWAILAALGMANRTVKIITPYFIPNMVLISALNHAALRGVDVSVILPEKNNLRFVQWASFRQYQMLLKNGVRIYHTPPPFDHSKLMTVDGAWALFGSTNWDARSLRLNFEFNVECFDDAFVHSLETIADGKIAAAKEITYQYMKARPLYQKLRDGLVWLLSPYL